MGLVGFLELCFFLPSLFVVSVVSCLRHVLLLVCFRMNAQHITLSCKRIDFAIACPPSWPTGRSPPYVMQPMNRSLARALIAQRRARYEHERNARRRRGGNSNGNNRNSSSNSSSSNPVAETAGSTTIGLAAAAAAATPSINITNSGSSSRSNTSNLNNSNRNSSSNGGPATVSGR